MPAELVVSCTATETSIYQNALVLNIGSKTFDEKMQNFNYT
jgi:hypothetical protein